MPCGLDDVGAAASGRSVRSRANDDCLRTNRGETIDVCTKLNLDDIVFGQDLLRLWVRSVGRDKSDRVWRDRGIVRTYARGEKCATALLTEMQVGKASPGGVVSERGARLRTQAHPC